MYDWFLVALGLVILLLSGDVLVRGAVNLSLRLGVPALIVSLTIVAFGTSAPELLITIDAVSEGYSGVALGNVIGSNTANILLVLGVPALITSMHTGECETRKNYLFMIIATLLFIGVCLMGPITWWHSIILLSALAFVLLDAARQAHSHRLDCKGDDIDDLEGVDPHMPWWRIGAFMVLGLIGLPLGADLLVDSSITIAQAFGLSDAVIGLTLVAIGTSLPELATTVMAAIRRQADVALGNVIGSNMFNLLAIMGVGGFIAPIAVPAGLLQFDLWVMLGASLLLLPFVFFNWNLTRRWGVVLTGGYVAYIGTILFSH